MESLFFFSPLQDPIGSQKAMSLPSSPHDYRSQNSERSGCSGYVVNDELVSTWNKVLQSSMFNNQPLLPYQEWNIDFSELTVGTRVGIGKYHFRTCCILGFEKHLFALFLPIILYFYHDMSLLQI